MIETGTALICGIVILLCYIKKKVEECLCKLLCAPYTLLCCCRKHAYRQAETSEFGLDDSVV